MSIGIYLVTYLIIPIVVVFSIRRKKDEYENLDKETQTILEVSAIVHDIACPLCREKYGNTNGKYQEIEGEILTAEFLKDTIYNVLKEIYKK